MTDNINLEARIRVNLSLLLFWDKPGIGFPCERMEDGWDFGFIDQAYSPANILKDSYVPKVQLKSWEIDFNLWATAQSHDMNIVLTIFISQYLNTHG